MASIKDERGYNQGFELLKSTEIRMRRRAALMLSQMDLISGKNILEIGCGTGEISYWIAQQTEASVLGTDLSKVFITDAQKKYILANLSYDLLDFNKAEEFNGKKFDYIIGNGILHHLYFQLDKALVNMRQLLTENGKIVFMEPNLYNPYIYSIFSYQYLRKKANLEPDEMAFTKSYISDKLHKNGYTDIQVSYKDFLLPGVPDFMITPLIVAGNIFEKIPVIKKVSQSIFITAKNA